MRFSMVLLLALLPVALASAGDGEDSALQFVERLGGFTVRDKKAPGQPVIEVNLMGKKLTDPGLRDLARFSKIKRLFISSTEVTDRGLQELAGLKQLEVLNLSRTKVTGTGLSDLAPLKQLQLLALDGTQVTDASLREIKGLKGLRKLFLRETR
jgi:hypothetical protein